MEYQNIPMLENPSLIKIKIIDFSHSHSYILSFYKRQSLFAELFRRINLLLIYMGFTPADFEKQEIQTKLNGVIMGSLFHKPIGSFRSLSKIKQMNYNKELNAYIRANLQGDNWEDVLTKDFNSYVCSYLDDPRQYNINEVDCKTCDDTKILLKPEQYEFYKSEADKGDTYSKHILHFAEKGQDFLLETSGKKVGELEVCNHAC